MSPLGPAIPRPGSAAGQTRPNSAAGQNGSARPRTSSEGVDAEVADARNVRVGAYFDFYWFVKEEYMLMA